MTTSTPPTPSAPPPRRRRWPRRVAILLAVLVLLVVLAPLALSLPFVRGVVADKVAAAIGREVSIDGASAFWGKGIDLEGITVRSPEGFDEPLATVEHVHVDLDVLALLAGDLDAAIQVQAPRVNLLQDASGRSNASGLFPAEAEETPEEEKASVRLRLRVRDGAVRARPSPDAAYQEVTGLSTDVELHPDGALSVSLDALARAAGRDGGDVPLSAEASLTAEGKGPFSLRVPVLDLGRLASLIEQATGLRGVTGTVELTATGEARGGSDLTLQLASRANGLAFRTGGDLRIGIEQLLASASVDQGSGGTSGEITVKTEAVELLDGSGPEARSFREPQIEITLKGRRDVEQDAILVDAGRIAAGGSLTATVSQPWRIVLGPSPKAVGQLDLQGDLGKLSALRSIAPALEPLRSGLLAGRVIAQASDGLDLSAGLRVQGLELAPGDISRDGYREDDLVVRLQVKRRGGAVQPLDVLLYEVRSTPLRMTTPDQQPFRITVTEGGFRANGVLTSTIDLPSLSQAIGGVLALAPRERIGGTVEVRTEAHLEDDTGVVSSSVTGRGLRLPRSWVADVAPTDLLGTVVARLTERRIEVALTDVRGFGLTAKGSATLPRGEAGGSGLPETASIEVTGNLAEASRALLVPLLGLPADTRMGGALEARTNVDTRGTDRRVHGTVAVTSLAWTDGKGVTLLEERRLELKHDLVLGADGKTVDIADLRVVGQTIDATLKGSARSLPDATQLDLTLGLQGDAGRLASVLRGALGEDYRDLKGSGPVRGSGRVAGSTAEGGRNLVIESSVEAGSWSVGGMAIANANLAVRRAAPAEPLDARLTAGVNTGRADVRLQVRLEPAATPWSTKVQMQQVDTAPLLVDQGIGQYLTYVLPTLIPADAAAPVLSGRLDAEVELGAGDLSGTRMEQTLNGQGWIRMAQGSLGESTLFKAVGGGQGLGEVGRILTTAVPEVGRALAGLTRTISFSRLESRFRVANRVVTVQHGLLEGEQARIAFQGTVGFNEVLDMKMDVAPAGAAGDKLARVLPSRTIPLGVKGTLEKPTVVPNLKASDLTAGALNGLLPGGGKDGQKSPLDRIRDLVPR